ncbi:uncharacterized protein LOC144365029 isoform X2 [Ictidomys tridecemlineatus]
MLIPPSGFSRPRPRRGRGCDRGGARGYVPRAAVGGVLRKGAPDGRARRDFGDPSVAPAPAVGPRIGGLPHVAQPPRAHCRGGRVLPDLGAPSWCPRVWRLWASSLGLRYSRSPALEARPCSPCAGRAVGAASQWRAAGPEERTERPGTAGLGWIIPRAAPMLGMEPWRLTLDLPGVTKRPVTEEENLIWNSQFQRSQSIGGQHHGSGLEPVNSPPLPHTHTTMLPPQAQSNRANQS